jgi:MoaA/NifB/PqqE/SkfB family radical SAM enzyme
MPVFFCHDKEAQNGEVVPWDQIVGQLEKGRSDGLTRVVLSGGEATIHPKFIEVVNLSARLGYKHIQVVSNGRAFAYGSFLADAVSAGLSEITFSFHGHNSAVHDNLTGVPGSFDQAFAGLVGALRQPGLIVSIDTVINKQNYRHIFDIIEFFSSFGVREFDLLQIIPFGDAWLKWEDLGYDQEVAGPYLRKAFDYAASNGIVLWTNRCNRRHWLVMSA